MAILQLPPALIARKRIRRSLDFRTSNSGMSTQAERRSDFADFFAAFFAAPRHSSARRYQECIHSGWCTGCGSHGFEGAPSEIARNRRIAMARSQGQAAGRAAAVWVFEAVRRQIENRQDRGLNAEGICAGGLARRMGSVSSAAVPRQVRNKRNKGNSR